MGRTRVKICGITRVEDALAVVRLGADAIGLVFYPGSPRCVTPEAAAHIAAALPPFVSTVGLFVNAGADDVAHVLRQVRLDVLQFHGEEPATFCSQFGRPYLKAVRVGSETNLIQCAADYASASALLLDTLVEGVPGGTGRSFDWSLIPAGIARPLVLAGGLHAGNVAQAVRQVRPYAVDVSGGVERAPGIKDEVRMAAFMQSLTAAEHS